MNEDKVKKRILCVQHCALILPVIILTLKNIKFNEIYEEILTIGLMGWSEWNLISLIRMMRRSDSIENQQFNIEFMLNNGLKELSEILFTSMMAILTIWLPKELSDEDHVRLTLKLCWCILVIMYYFVLFLYCLRVMQRKRRIISLRYKFLFFCVITNMFGAGLLILLSLTKFPVIMSFFNTTLFIAIFLSLYVVIGGFILFSQKLGSKQDGTEVSNNTSKDNHGIVDLK